MTNDVKVSDLLPLYYKALNEKWGYIWGGKGQIHTQAAQDAATREQTIKWGQKWVGKHVVDCSGLFSWAYQSLGGFMYHGSNTMWKKYAAEKGKLLNGFRDDGKPLKPGTAVFLTKGEDRIHVGVYVGSGEVIEAKGTYYGVVKSSVKVWNEWAELITTVYDVPDGACPVPAASDSPETTSECAVSDSNAVTVTLPVLKDKSAGEAVKSLQRLLNGCGYNCGAVDGKFGTKTTNAVKSFQTAKSLTVDGICGVNTWKALLGV